MMRGSVTKDALAPILSIVCVGPLTPPPLSFHAHTLYYFNFGSVRSLKALSRLKMHELSLDNL